MIVISHGGVGESALWWLGKSECVAFYLEFSVALIQKEQRAGSANDQQILQTFVFEIGEDGASGGIEHAEAGLFGHIFKRSIAAIAIQAIGKAGRLTDI